MPSAQGTSMAYGTFQCSERRQCCAQPEWRTSFKSTVQKRGWRWRERIRQKAKAQQNQPIVRIYKLSSLSNSPLQQSIVRILVKPSYSDQLSVNNKKQESYIPVMAGSGPLWSCSRLSIPQDQSLDNYQIHNQNSMTAVPLQRKLCWTLWTSRCCTTAYCKL